MNNSFDFELREKYCDKEFDFRYNPKIRKITVKLKVIVGRSGDTDEDIAYRLDKLGEFYLTKRQDKNLRYYLTHIVKPSYPKNFLPIELTL